MGKEQSFNKWSWDNLTSQMQKNEVGPPFHPYTKIKCINELNIRHKTVKLFEEYTGSDKCDFGFGHRFLDMTPQEHEQQKKKQANQASLKWKTFMQQYTLSKKQKIQHRKRKCF